MYKTQYTTSKKPKFYKIEYLQDKRYTDLHPVQLKFYHKSDKSNRNNCYISNIHKTNDISGTNMMKFVISLLKKLGVKHATIYDGTSVKCGNERMDLTLQKLIVNGSGFYERFGFSYIVVDDWHINQFDNTKNLKKILKDKLTIFRKITVKEYIKLYQDLLDLIFSVIKKQDFKNVDIAYYDDIDEYRYESSDNINEKLIKMLGNINEILGVLFKTKKKYIYQVMKDTFKDSCQEYVKIINNIIEGNYIQFVKYKNKKVNFMHRHTIDIIKTIRYTQLAQDLY